MNAAQKLLNQKTTYTVREVATILGISKSVAHRAVRSGEIPSVRTGPKKKTVTIERPALLEHIAAHGLTPALFDGQS